MAPPLALAVPSLIALLLVAADRRRAEPRRWVAFLVAVTAYGVVRSLAVRAVTVSAFGGSAPYGFGGGGPAVAGVPLQELAGWVVAAGLAWAVGEGLVGALRRPATPHRVALAAALVLAALSCAVETAAISAGWWRWSLDLPVAGGWRLVPWIAVVDWGFVAFDFLLPFLLWTSPAGAAQRWAATALLPLHMGSHLLVAPLPPPLLLGGFDWLHAAILGYVAACAWGEADGGSTAAVGRRLAPLAGAAAGAVLLGVALGLAGAGAAAARWLAVLPLVAVAVLAAWPRRHDAPPAPAAGGSVVWVRAAIVVAALVGVYALRAEPARRQQGYRAALERGMDRWSAGDVAGAETALRDAVALRGDAADGHWLLGLAMLTQGRAGEARRELELASAAAPSLLEPAALLAALDLRQGATSSAARRVARLKREHPLSAEAVYLDAVASGSGVRQAADVAVARAAEQGGEALARLGRVAGLLGDAGTVRRCAAATAQPRDR